MKKIRSVGLLMGLLMGLLIGLLIGGIPAGASAFAQDDKPFRLIGTIQGEYSGPIYSARTDFHGKLHADTLTVVNGSFILEGTMPHTLMVYLYSNTMSMDDPNTTSFFLDPGNSEIVLSAGEFKNARFAGEGVKTQNDFKAHEQAKAEMRKEHPADPQLAEKNIRAADLDFISDHPHSHVSAYLLRGYITRMSKEEGERYYHLLAPELQASGLGKFVKSRLDVMLLGLPGTKAIPFTVDDVQGNSLNLADFKGKYVLLDFWASWCIPCRNSHPHLREIYALYHDKGLEIIGVSDDDSRPEKWREAIETDSIGVWHHVLRNIDVERLKKGESNYVLHPNEISGSKYNVSVLPTKILIDPSGTIVARFTGNMSDLDKELASIFGK